MEVDSIFTLPVPQRDCERLDTLYRVLGFFQYPYNPRPQLQGNHYARQFFDAEAV